MVALLKYKNDFFGGFYFYKHIMVHFVKTYCYLHSKAYMSQGSAGVLKAVDNDGNVGDDNQSVENDKD